MSTLGERLKYVFEHERIKQKSFAEKNGFTPSAISNYIQNRSCPDPAFLKLLKTEFPLLNLNWLIAEIGEPFEKGELPGEAVWKTEMQAMIQRELSGMRITYGISSPQTAVYEQIAPPDKLQKRGQRSKTEPVCNNGSLRRVRFFEPVQDYMKVYRLVSR